MRPLSLAEAGSLVRVTMASRGLTYTEAADCYHRLACETNDKGAEGVYLAARAWAQCAAIWGTVDLDRSAEYQKGNPS